jgi:hypothetical protein
MNRDKLYRFVKSITFVLLLIAAISYFFSVFRIKSWEGIFGMDIFYKLPKNTVDVLVLGSSHAFMHINPAILFSEYGITSFVLGGANQPFWNTYFYLYEALKTQKFEAVILEAYKATLDTEYESEANIVKNTYGMKPSMRYVNALKVSAPKKDFWEYLFRFTRYHNRYAALSKNDFSRDIEPAVETYNIGGYNLWIDWKGFLALYYHTPLEKPEVDNIIDRSPMTTKTELYYRKIIELCIDRNIPLEIVVTPYPISSQHMQIFNYAYDIALEYNIPFTNLNNSYDKIGFDFSLDMAIYGHANHRGSIKISRYVGNQLKEKYTISDKRNNQLYASWQRNADHFWQNIYNQNLKECRDLDEYSKLIVNNQYYFPIVSAPPEILKSFNVDNNKARLSVETQNATIECINIGSLNRFKQLGSVMISLDKMNNILINGAKIRLNENEINLLIYDQATDKIVDNVSLDYENSVVIHQ